VRRAVLAGEFGFRKGPFRSRDRKGAVELRSQLVIYLITFACYGRRLHGAEAGTVDRQHSVPGTPTLEVNPARAAAEKRRMDQASYNLDQIRRDTVLNAIQEVCSHRGWRLLAAHVRSDHMHIVVEAEIAPERVMSDFKAYASRGLNRLNLDEPNRKRWARHGSTRWLWKPQHVAAAIQYVVAEQGDAMSVFESLED
jgi:REP element-mobilizing transposase RayT